MKSVAQMMLELEPDKWRQTNPFSKEVSDALNRQQTEPVDAVINEWLAKYQPCVFGRVASRANTIDFCVLSEKDLEQSDDTIARTLQNARAKWKSRAYIGESSAFLICLSSKRLAEAAPNRTMRDIAIRICQLYLVADEIKPDLIYTDTVELEIPTKKGKRAALMFDVGMNVFAAAGDGRWWQDHRIPCGLVFSLNAVGHLVKSGRLSVGMSNIESLLETSPTESPPKLESLSEALRWAMQTIANASNATSGKATTLLPLDHDRHPFLECPITMPKGLSGKDYCEYAGWYHTDITIPSEYFQLDVARPESVQSHALDFTYLFDSRLDNPAHQRIAAGIKVRGIKPSGDIMIADAPLSSEAIRKRARAVGNLEDS